MGKAISGKAIREMRERERKAHFKKALRPNTKLACITLASNLTGEIVYDRCIGNVCAMQGITVFVDASQGGGKMLVNMQDDHIDYLAFTGHKDIFALPGVGGLCSMKPLSMPNQMELTPHGPMRPLNSGITCIFSIWTHRLAVIST